MKKWTMAALGLAGVMVVTASGCSTSSTSSRPSAPVSPQSPASPSPSVTSAAPGVVSPGTASKVSCKEIGKLRTSLTSLTKTKISPSSAGTLTTDIKNIQTELTALKGKAGGAFASQANSLMDSVDQIKKASASLNTSPISAIRQLTTALVGLKAKAKPVIKEMNAACPK